MIVEAREKMGLNEPLFIQYGNWLKNAIQMDFGKSLINNQSVKDDIEFTAKNTLKVSALSTLLQIILVFSIAWLEYMIIDKKGKSFFNMITILLVSIPTFYIAFLYMDVFAVKANLMSIINSSGFLRYFSPALCIALPAAAFHGRLLGSILNKERKKDYVFFLQCRGLSDNKIFFCHVLPHGLLILIPIFMQNLGLIMASSGVIEKMFNVTGVGYLLIDHTIARDASMIHACLLFFAVVMVITNVSGKILQVVLGQENRGV